MVLLASIIHTTTAWLKSNRTEISITLNIMNNSLTKISSLGKGSLYNSIGTYQFNSGNSDVFS